MKHRKTNKKLPAGLLGVATGVIALAVYLGATLASQTAAPLQIDFANPNPGYKQLDVGAAATESMPGQISWASTNSAAAGIVKLSNSTAQVTGIAPGTTQIVSATMRGGFGRRANYQVTDPDGIASVILPDAGTISIGIDESGASIAAATIPENLEGLIVWEPQAGDDDIITVTGTDITVKQDAQPGLTGVRGTLTDKYGVSRTIYIAAAYGVEAMDGGTPITPSGETSGYAFGNPYPQYKQLAVGATVAESLPGQISWVSSHAAAAGVEKKSNSMADVTGVAPGTSQIISTTMRGSFGRRSNYQVADPGGAGEAEMPSLGMLILEQTGADIVIELDNETAIDWAPLNGEDDFIEITGTHVDAKPGAQPGFTGVVGTLTDKWGAERQLFVSVAYGLQVEGSTPTNPPVDHLEVRDALGAPGVPIEQIAGDPFDPEGLKFWFVSEGGTETAIGTSQLQFTPNPVLLSTTSAYAYCQYGLGAGLTVEMPLVNGVVEVFDPWPDDFGLPDNMPGEPPVARVGRVLKAADMKDTSDWIEIASKTDVFGTRYSLILRVDAIGSAGNAGNPYSGSAQRTAINNFMKNTLPGNSPIRDYSVNFNATDSSYMGTYNTVDDSTISQPGFTPFPYNDGLTTDDIAFALNYTEALRFCSWGSNVKARYNYSQLGAGKSFWLRSPDGSSNMAYVNGSSTPNAGVPASANANSGSYFYRPAIWVDSELFGKQKAPTGLIP